MTNSSSERDFIISYHRADQHWAEWIAWQLEENAYTVLLQAWDFRPGSNFISEMQRATKSARKTIVVLSSNYINSRFTQAEWAAAFATDPTGERGTLIPVRVEPIKTSGLFAAFVYIDLVGKGDDAARVALLQGLPAARAKPSEPPRFPSERAAPTKPLAYPGAALPDPPEINPYLEHFKYDHADPRRTAFIMMKFGRSKRHRDILNACRRSLGKYQIQGLRADDKAYADYLMANIRTYMHGCGFGIAIFERIESDLHNPNVALEVGYMMALGKPVCLLKDRTLRRLPTDIMGALYREFDFEDLDTTIDKSLSRWLIEKRIIDDTPDTPNVI